MKLCHQKTAAQIQRPAKLSVPDTRSLHNTLPVNYFALKVPLLATSTSVGGYHVTQQFATGCLPKLTLTSKHFGTRSMQ